MRLTTTANHTNHHARDYRKEAIDALHGSGGGVVRRFRLRLGPADVRIQVARREQRERVADASDGLVFEDAAGTAPVPREAQRALDFLRDPAMAGDGRQPNPVAQQFLREHGDRLDTATDLEAQVAALSWYHTIELPGGVVTPGNHDHRRLPERIGLPADLTGCRALDVATFDGFWAFELERRGAQVTAIDLPTVSHLDWPTGAREIVARERLDVELGRGFDIAAGALRSDVQRRSMSVYDLDPSEVGTFDLVFVGDLLLHLERPLDALRAIRSVARGRVILIDRYDPALPPGEGLLRYRGGWHGLEWWAPALDTLLQWIVDAGFSEPRVHTAYRLGGHHRDQPGWSRIVVHATAGEPTDEPPAT